MEIFKGCRKTPENLARLHKGPGFIVEMNARQMLIVLQWRRAHGIRVPALLRHTLEQSRIIRSQIK